MRKAVTVPAVVIASGGMLALGFAVAALASSSSSSTSASTSETATAHTSTSETTTTETSTTEQPSTSKFSATLGSREEVPKTAGVSAAAGGTFAVTLTDSGPKFSVTWKLKFHNLTGKAVAAHIHRGKPGKAGPVLLALCGPCKNGQTGKAPLSETAGTALKSGSAYVNVHTAKNAAGELRGQLRKAH